MLRDIGGYLPGRQAGMPSAIYWVTFGRVGSLRIYGFGKDVGW
ncbi:hypothetical protein ADIS_0232 [Lunatimonas lonarensis]|uniref:Uncharacterized protein n=1 Tax=Lunatimonas lonarensis TaxID=1232681 RepID=R7ZYQ2_9BACT|nr:hypothetical protein ADIS_0232 [Lunatimonas lonarensis]